MSPIGKGEASQHILCLDLSQHVFRVAIIHRTEKKIAQRFQWEISRFEREEVEVILLKEDFFKFDFHDTVLSSGKDRNTLVPVEIFNHTKAPDVFRLNFTEPFDNVDYTRISELGIVNVYEFPMWIKSLFVVKFPRIKIVHRSTVFLRAMFDQPSFRTKIHLLVEAGQTYVGITSKSRLQFLNLFPCRSASDIAFHALFVMEQRNIDRKELEIVVYGKPVDWNERAELEKLMEQKVNIGNTVEQNEDFLLYKHLLCV